MQSYNRRRTGRALYMTSAPLFALYLANWRYPVIGWSDSLSAAWIAVAAWVLPWLAVIGIVLSVRGGRRWLGMLAISPILLLSAVAIFWNYSDAQYIAKAGEDAAHKPVARIVMPDGSLLVTYQLDCGATCAYAVMLRHERRIFGPLMLVHDVTRSKSGETLDVRVLDERHVLVDKVPYTLRSHVVF